MEHAWAMRLHVKNSMSMTMEHILNSHGQCMEAHGLSTRFKISFRSNRGQQVLGYLRQIVIIIRLCIQSGSFFQFIPYNFIEELNNQKLAKIDILFVL